MDPPFRSMNVGGWRSDERLFDWYLPAVAELRALIEDHLVGEHLRTLAGLDLVGWAVVNRRGSYHKRHNHLGCVSGIYYVDPGDYALASGGTTTLERGDLPVPAEQRVYAVPGRLAIFPSDTWHRVTPYEADEPRITIAFDVR